MDKNALWQLMVQFVKFGIVGVLNVLVSLGIYYLFVYAGMHYILANTLGYGASILNAYFWNSRKVFNERQDNEFKALVKTFVVYGLSFLLSSMLLYLQVDMLGMSDKVAPVISLIITIPINFFMNKYWIYAGK